MIVSNNNVNESVKSIGLGFQFRKLIAGGMRNGNKTLISRQLFLALVYVKEIVSDCFSSYRLLESVLSCLEPPFDLCKTKKSGRTFFIPRPCRKARRQFLAIRFFWEGVNYRSKKLRSNLAWAIATEINDLRTKQRRYNCFSYKRRREFLRSVFKYKFSTRFFRNF